MMQNWSDENKYWIAGEITRSLTWVITSVLSVAIAIPVVMLVIFIGGWLAYTYLPPTVFTILAIVVLADIALAITLLMIRSRRPTN